MGMAEIKRTWFKTIGYTPHPQQWSFHLSDARFRIPCCGRRFGKSTMAARDLEPHLMLPNKRFWVVGPTYDLGEKEFRVVWNDLIIGQQLGKDKRVKKSYNKKSGSMSIEFPWGTLLEVRSADHPDNLVGEALDGVIMSEAAKQKLETWQRFIRPSLSDKRGFATFPTTPEGFNWLYDLWGTGQDPNKPLYQSWTFPSWANTVVYPDGRQDAEILDLEENSEPEWFMQEIGAEFSAFVGKIYGEFNERIHVTDVKYNPDWPNYVTFDWGWANPMAGVEFQVGPDDTIYVWRMFYKKHMTTSDFVRMMDAAPKPEGYRVVMAFGDHARPDAAVEVTKLYSEFAERDRKAGMARSPYENAVCITDPDAKKDWNQGVEKVKEFLKVKEEVEIIDDDGSYRTKAVTHFQLDRECKEAIVEFNNYRTKESPNGTNVPEMGQKVKDHFLDAIRYGIMHLFELGVAVHLEEFYKVKRYDVGSDSGIVVPNTVEELLVPDMSLWVPDVEMYANGMFMLNRGISSHGDNNLGGYDTFDVYEENHGAFHGMRF
jgi:hypothetical protein